MVPEWEETTNDRARREYIDFMEIPAPMPTVQSIADATNIQIASGVPVLFDGLPTSNWREHQNEPGKLVCDTPRGTEIVADFTNIPPLVPTGFGATISRAVMKQSDDDPKWIPVGERLPDNGAKCLVASNRNSDPEMATYDDGQWIEMNYEASYGAVRIYSVTHWMPLPEMPK